MLRTYFKLTIRHLWQHKLYSAINVFGLSVAIACMLLAVLYWQDERSFDNFHSNNPRLYRVTTTMADSKTGEWVTSGGTGQVQGPAFKNAVPEVEQYTRLLGGEISGDVTANNKALHLQMLFTDENFFNLFTFQVLKGNPQTALNDISSIVLTESVARRFFNSIDVIGKPVSLTADPSAKHLGRPMQVTAVVKDLPKNSSIQFEVLMPMKFFQLSFVDDNWLNAYLGTFVVLHPKADAAAVAKKFDKVFATHARQQVAESIKTYNYDPKIHYGLQQMTDIHLQPFTQLTGNTEGGVINGSKPLYSYLFMGIAVFILLMASVNFINISIANSLKRAKEVGVRKITGGSRLQIIVQFLAESATLCLAAFIIASVLMQTALPLFNTITSKQILLEDAFNIQLAGWLAAILLIIILLTGFYPAYTLSRLQPAEVLYNRQKLSGRNLFGKGLVVFQFSLAVFLMIATLVYHRQMRFIEVKNLGYNPSMIIRTHIGGDREVQPITRYLKNEVGKDPALKMISFGGGESTYEVKIGDTKIDALHQVIDENYLPALEIPLKLGRNLSPLQYPSDSFNAVLVNEAFVKAAGLQQPLGTRIKTDEYFDKETKVIVGVVKDYHFGSLRQPIQPAVMFMNNWYGGGIWVKLDKARLQQGLRSFEQIYKKAIPGAVYSYRFLDEMNARQYEQERRWQKIITAAAILSVLICCLGLFGLAHLSTHQRTKEIGIRKVLGATVTQIATLISTSFLKLVLLSFLIAAPLAWLIMNQWLQNFAYRISVGAGTLIVSAAAAVMVALLAISFQAVKAAIANPVKSLRTE
ncbi:ABC transporter permease [Foetidibacter luteolus]|uniref:ABC transporter permease n=1 Tax=Foetidibacter luteolus TaxID=2608880 RepID=UPI001A989852|nr:ABC transporter permease [Foetidibacter luteolus]